MSLTTFKIGRKEFVVLPRRRYEQLTRAEQDQKDAAIARKGVGDRREVYRKMQASDLHRASTQPNAPGSAQRQRKNPRSRQR